MQTLCCCDGVNNVRVQLLCIIFNVALESSFSRTLFIHPDTNLESSNVKFKFSGLVTVLQKRKRKGWLVHVHFFVISLFLSFTCSVCMYVWHIVKRMWIHVHHQKSAGTIWYFFGNSFCTDYNSFITTLVVYFVTSFWCMCMLFCN